MKKEDKNQIDKLLNEFTDLVKKYEEKNESVKKSFNIFSILDVATDEVKICRVLQEFLSPKGSHNKEDLFLKEFIEIFLQLKDFDYKTARVDKEYYIENGRRIDLVIESCNYFIPIEVKINARDQDSQCYDYYSFGKKYTKETENCDCPFIVYLTIDGKAPSEQSSGKLDSKQIKTISFEKDIKSWLEKIKNEKLKTESTIRETIEQFLNTINTYTGKIVEDEMVEKIMESSENMKNACFITQHLNEAKIEMLTNIFRTIDKYVTTLDSPISNEKFKSSFNKELEEHISKYYGAKPNTAKPVLRYEYKAIENTNKKIIFEVSLDDYLYWGFVVENKKNITQRKLATEELTKYLPHLNNTYKNDDKKWIASEYLYSEKKENRPNFFDISPTTNSKDIYFELFNDDFYHKFIEKCTKDITVLLQK